VYNGIGAVAEQELLMDGAIRLGNNISCAQLFELGSDFQRSLKIITDGDEAEVEICDAQ